MTARVKNGRLVMDEPTELPEGSVVALDVAKEWDELDDEDRLRLHDALDAAEADLSAGRTVSEDDVRTVLRAIR